MVKKLALLMLIEREPQNFKLQILIKESLNEQTSVYS